MFSAKLNEVLASKKSFISDRLNTTGLLVSLAINIIHWAFLLFKIGRGSFPVLLRYNVVTGPAIVDQARYLYFVPATALIFLLINILAGYVMYRKERLPAYFLSYSNIPVQMVFFVASVVLVIFNEQ